MQFQIDTQHDLREQQEHKERRKRGVDVLRELAAFMGVSEEVGDNGDDGTDTLEGDVPS